MNPNIEQELIEKGYYVSERWRIRSVLGFIRQELSNKGIWLHGFQLLLFVLVGLGLYFGYRDISRGVDWLWGVIIPFGAGILAMLLMVVPHELIHGIAYKMTGAQKVIYGADWSKMVFHASAPYHPIDYKQMLLVAFAPFVVLTALLLLGLVLSSGQVWWGLFGLLLMHTQGCFGDFAMVNFFARQEQPEDWITFDDSREETFVLLVKDQ